MAETKNAEGKREIVGVARLSRNQDPAEAEFALVISDNYQNRGLGTQMLQRLLDVARAEKIRSVKGHIMSENLEMRRVCEKVGFNCERMMDEPLVKAEIRPDAATSL